MRIVIETDGHGDSTRISYNGVPQESIKEFNLSIRAGRNVKLQVVEEVAGKPRFMSFFGEDFKKNDEYLPKENSNGK